MIYDLLADALLLVHLGFVVFVVTGALAAFRWPKTAWLHLPALAWGVWIELTGGVCPLTPLENHLRRLGGGGGYEGDFLWHYLGPVLYPAGLTRNTQLVLGLLALAWNVLLYTLLLFRRRRLRRRDRVEGA